MPLLVARHAAPATATHTPRTPTAPRKDIQALRALAVGAVVLNHLWPNRLSGGYVGVDVFFVISGYLITSHLFKEITASGRLRFARFYARRVLRLLPAAFLVITVSMVAVWVFLPYNMWADNAQQMFAASIYVENWVLATNAVDYLAQTQQPTAAQHYWSLSVEEQFYLVWPLLLVAGTALAHRMTRFRTRSTLIAVLTVAAVASLALSISMTMTSPAQAYFVTPVRVWEFALGGIVALALPRTPLPRLAAEALSLLGFGAIVFAAFVYGSTTHFPGTAALVPTLGTAAVLVAGSGLAALHHERLTGNKAVQFLGDVSYSVYLWHWPLVIILPFALAHPLTMIDKLAIAVGSVVLATLTKYTVEDPGRRWPWAHTCTWRTFAAMGAGIAITATLSGALLWQADRASSEAAQLAALRASGECAGPRSLTDARCPDPFGPAADVVMSTANEYWTPASECGKPTVVVDIDDKFTTRGCDFSGGNLAAPSVWVVGDSHVQQWEAALWTIARENRWHVTTSYLGGCPPAWFDHANPAPAQSADPCLRWQNGLTTTVLNARPDLVITSALTRTRPIDDGTGRSQEEQYADAFRAMWQPWLDAEIAVAVIADPPLNTAVRDSNCVVMNPQDPVACAVPRTLAAGPDPMALAARATPGVTLVDLTENFCNDTSCYAVIGAIPVYFDANHLNRVYAELLAPQLSRELPPVTARANARRDGRP